MHIVPQKFTDTHIFPLPCRAPQGESQWNLEQITRPLQQEGAELRRGGMFIPLPMYPRRGGCFPSIGHGGCAREKLGEALLFELQFK